MSLLLVFLILAVLFGIGGAIKGLFWLLLLALLFALLSGASFFGSRRY
jgi:hypothetical protein